VRHGLVKIEKRRGQLPRVNSIRDA
jgi:hypothetical protein